MRLRNISGLGDLDIPGVGLVPAGAEFDTDDAGLLAQAANFEVVTDDPPPVTPPPPAAPEPTPEPAPEAGSSVPAPEES